MNNNYYYMKALKCFPERISWLLIASKCVQITQMFPILNSFVLSQQSYDIKSYQICTTMAATVYNNTSLLPNALKII